MWLEESSSDKDAAGLPISSLLVFWPWTKQDQNIWLSKLIENCHVILKKVGSTPGKGWGWKKPLLSWTTDFDWFSPLSLSSDPATQTESNCEMVLNIWCEKSSLHKSCISQHHENNFKWFHWTSITFDLFLTPFSAACHVDLHLPSFQKWPPSQLVFSFSYSSS